jgi:hypothetical protein
VKQIVRFSIYFMILASFPACSWSQKAEVVSKRIRLGACPTMRHHYLPDAIDSADYRVLPFSNTKEVMAALRAKEIDIAYVGRPARISEGVTGLSAFPLRTGWTLVGRSNRIIDESAFAQAVVHTSADSLIIKRYLPPAVTIRSHASISAALDSCGQDEVVLLSWDDYDESYPLVIPSNIDGKLPRFRSPTLYCRKGDEGKYISVVEHIRDYVSEKEVFNK